MDFFFFSISNILKNYGQQLKAPAAMVRLRLYETLLILPPQSFEGMQNSFIFLFSVKYDFVVFYRFLHSPTKNAGC